MFERVVDEAEALGDHFAVFAAIDGIASIHLEQQRLEDARDCYRRAVEVMERSGIGVIAPVYLRYAISLLKLEEDSEAVQMVESALRDGLDSVQPGIEAALRATLAAGYAALSNWEEVNAQIERVAGTIGDLQRGGDYLEDALEIARARAESAGRDETARRIAEFRADH